MKRHGPGHGPRSYLLVRPGSAGQRVSDHPLSGDLPLMSIPTSLPSSCTTSPVSLRFESDLSGPFHKPLLSHVLRSTNCLFVAQDRRPDPSCTDGVTRGPGAPTRQEGSGGPSVEELWREQGSPPRDECTRRGPRERTRPVVSCP